MFFKYNWPWIAWAIIILVLLSMPGSNLPKPIFGIKNIDKVGHFGIFFVLVVLIIFGLKKQYTVAKLRSHGIVYASLFAFTWAVMTEFVQLAATERSFEYKDILANIAGVLGGIVFCLIVKKKLVFLNN